MWQWLSDVIKFLLGTAAVIGFLTWRARFKRRIIGR